MLRCFAKRSLEGRQASHRVNLQKFGPGAGFIRSRGALVVWPSFAGHPAGVSLGCVAVFSRRSDQ